MKITNRWLEEHDACSEAVAWVQKQKTRDVKQLTKRLFRSRSSEKLVWANRAIVRILNTTDCITYARYAADSVKHLLNCANTAAAAAAYAAFAADTAAFAADTADTAARAAIYAAAAAAYAANADYATDYATDYAADAAAYAADADAAATYAAAYRKSIRKYIRYGLKLLEEAAND